MKRILYVSLAVGVVAACALAGTAQRAVAGELVFRDLARKYFKDGDGSDLAKLVGYAQPVQDVIALEYKVLLAREGREVAVDPKTHEFKIGDKIRLQVEPLSSYYIYIFHKGASGKGYFLLPAENEPAKLVKARASVALPDDGFFEFTDPAGEETVIVVATEEPIKDLVMLARLLGKKEGEADTPEEEALRKSLKATVKKALKSIRERQQELLDNSVTFRGLATDEAIKGLVKDVTQRGVKEGTFEEPPGQAGGPTCALYVSLSKQKQPKLLVSIPLKSIKAVQ